MVHEEQLLFEQLSSQLNFLLLAQRQMILVGAFAVAIATFGHNIKTSKIFRKVYITYLVLVLLAYSIAIGIKSALDFNGYIAEILDKSSLHEDEIKMVNRSKTWVYFSYFLIAIVVSLNFIIFKMRSLL